MKRIFVLLLGIAMLLNFSACSSSEPSVPATAPVAETVPATEAASPTEAPETIPAQSAATMGETVLIDNDVVAFAITKAEHNDHLGMQLHVQCVNKTDRTLMFSWDMVSVCGYMYDPFWAAEVAAGKTALSTIDLDTYALEEMGIRSVDEITFTLRISDSENWMEPPLAEQVFTIYPTGLNAQSLVLPQRPATDTQVVIADDENIRFVIERTEESASSYTLHTYIENKTNRNLLYSWDLVSVNGMMIDPFWATSITPGKKACCEITFHRTDLEERGITAVSDIAFTLIVSDYDDWETGNLLETAYTYTP